MAQDKGEKYKNEEGKCSAYNPLHSTGTSQNIESTETHIDSATAGHEIEKGAEGQGYEKGKQSGGGEILHPDQKGADVSLEDDSVEGGGRKKKGVTRKGKLPGGDGGILHPDQTGADISGEDCSDDGDEWKKKCVIRKMKGKRRSRRLGKMEGLDSIGFGVQMNLGGDGGISLPNVDLKFEVEIINSDEAQGIYD